MRLTSPAISATATMLLVVLAGLSGNPSSAVAGEVHFDSQSPAGKEYALPLPQARGEALGTDAPANPPLFGVGVGGSGNGAEEGEGGTSQESGTREGTAAAKGGGRRRHKHRDRTPAREGGGNAPPGGGGSGSSRPPSSRPVVISSSSYGVGGGVALIAGLILVAILAGLALRRFPGRRAGALR